MTATLAPETRAAAIEVRPVSPVLSETGRPIALVEFRAGAGAPVVLDCTEVQVALFYSGTRLHWQLSADAAAALVWRGVQRLGLDQVRGLAAGHLADGVLSQHDKISVREYNGRERRRWPASEGGDQQRGRAQGLAQWLHGLSQGEPWPVRR